MLGLTGSEEASRRVDTRDGAVGGLLCQVGLLHHVLPPGKGRVRGLAFDVDIQTVGNSNQTKARHVIRGDT